MLLDIVIAALLVITSGYCWRLNRRMSSFRNAKTELEQMIRNFDGAIRQAYESIAILKENSSDKNIQLIRDMEKVRLLANDLAYLVEKGEKLADTLEGQVRQKPIDNVGSFAAPARSAIPPSLPARRRGNSNSGLNAPARPLAADYAAPQAPASAAPHALAPRLKEVEEMIDTLARSYVAEPSPMAAPVVKKAAQQQQKTQAIEKMLHQMSSGRTTPQATAPVSPQKAAQKPAAAAASIAPRQLARKLETTPPPLPKPALAAQAAAAAGRNRFFDSLRVVTPNE